MDKGLMALREKVAKLSPRPKVEEQKTVEEQPVVKDEPVAENVTHQEPKPEPVKEVVEVEVEEPKTQITAEELELIKQLREAKEKGEEPAPIPEPVTPEPVVDIEEEQRRLEQLNNEIVRLRDNGLFRVELLYQLNRIATSLENGQKG